MVIDISSQNSSAVLQAAFDLHNQGCLQEALKAYNSFLQVVPDHSDALHLYGLALHQSGDIKEAILTIRKAVSIAPHPLYLSNLAALQTSSGDQFGAVQSLSYAARLAPTDPNIKEALGSALIAINQIDKAKEYIEDSIRLGGGATSFATYASLLSMTGDFAEAVEYYRRSISSGLDSSVIHFALAQCLDALGLWQEAITELHRAAALDESDADALALAANIYAVHGLFEESLCSCLEVVKRAGETPETLDALGAAYWRRGALDAAIDTYYDALILAPNRVDTLNNISLVLLDAGRGEEAERHSRRATILSPGLVQPYVNLSDALALRGKHREAAETLLIAQNNIVHDLAEFERANANAVNAPANSSILRERLSRLKAADQIGAALIDHCAQIQHNNDLPKIFYWRIALMKDRIACMLSIADAVRKTNPEEYDFLLREAKDAPDQLGREAYNHSLTINDKAENRLGALELLKEVVLLAPNNTTIRNGYGILLLGAGRFEEGREQFQAALLIDPNNAEAYGNLGLTEINQYNSEGAIPFLKKAIEIDPISIGARLHLGNALQDVGQISAAEQAFKDLIKISPDLSAAWGNLAVVYQDMGQFENLVECSKKVHELAPDSAGKHSALLFGMQYLPDGDVDELAAELHKWGEAHAAPYYHKAKPFNLTPDQKNKKLKIGMLGADFKGHSSTYFMAPIFNNLNRDEFEIHVYGEIPNPDYWTNYFAQRANSFKLTYVYTDDQIADIIRSDEIDILIDLSCHTAGSRVLALARRPAPVQVSWIGIGNSTGMKTVDYFLTDEHYVPVGFERLFVEKPWRLPRNLYCYDPLNTMPEPCPKLISDRAPAFGCFSRLVRINDKVIDVWSDLLLELPGSTLLLNTKSFRDPAIVEQYMRKFEARGVSRECLNFTFITPTWNSWSAYNDIDVALDPFPHNAGLTTYESLWMGCPMVTMLDRPPQGCYGASILTNFGAPEWIARSPEEYVEIAMKLVSDPEKLLQLRLSMRERMRQSSLCDGASYTRDFEEALRGMWRERLAILTNDEG